MNLFHGGTSRSTGTFDIMAATAHIAMFAAAIVIHIVRRDENGRIYRDPALLLLHVLFVARIVPDSNLFNLVGQFLDFEFRRDGGDR